jgi:D-glycero-D-manno-heptose 1,7-bisphosphate phosphatase
MGVDALTMLPAAAWAVFLDRDGVINHNWFNPATGAWESPMRPEDFRLRAGALEALARLQGLGCALFLVSNQPSAAKGKCCIADLAAVHARLAALLDGAGIRFTDFFYAYGHPEAVAPELAGPVPGRKPDPFFLDRAIAEHALDRAACWMVGDRDSDIECGHRAGVRTIQVQGSEDDGGSGQASPDFRAADLGEAVAIVAGARRAEGTAA